MVYVVAEIAFALLGLLVGRFVAVVAPAVFWSAWGAGVSRGWWGHGGDAIVLGTVILIAGGAASALVGVLLRRFAVKARRS